MSKPHLLIVAASFYRDLTDALIDGARKTLAQAGATADLVEVPGALEVPATIAFASDTGRYDGYVALGCVIRGETTHYDTVCSESARGLMALGLDRHLAIGNGILTVEDEAQAWARARDGDKGGGAAHAALTLIALKRRLAGETQ